MPIYEYQCPNCQNVFEEWVKLSEAHGEEPCPKCGTKSPRLISHTSFVLKGGGWYVTDYGYRKGMKEDGGAKDDSAVTKDTASKNTAEASTSQETASTGAAPAKKTESSSGQVPAAPRADSPTPQAKAS